MNLGLMIGVAIALTLVYVYYTDNTPVYEGGLNVDVHTSDSSDTSIAYKNIESTPIDSSKVNNAYQESRLEVNCDKIKNKVSSSSEDVKHIWQERAKRLQC